MATTPNAPTNHGQMRRLCGGGGWEDGGGGTGGARTVATGGGHAGRVTTNEGTGSGSSGGVAEPGCRIVKEVLAHREAAIERVAELLLADVHTRQRYRNSRHDRQAALRRVGHRRERVDRRHLEREIGAPYAGKLRRQHEKVGALGEGRQLPGEDKRKMELVVRGGLRVLQ